MTGPHLRHAITALLAKLEPLGIRESRELIAREVEESGGSYIVPKPFDNWASCFVEINLLEVAAYGTDEFDAIRNWKRAARSVAAALPQTEGHAQC